MDMFKFKRKKEPARTQYTAIAAVYDLFNRDIDYSVWADFVENAFKKYLTTRPELVLDLACGTVRMTRELAARGYDMIGVDASCEMLSKAMEKTPKEYGALYLLQDMKEFELYGTVGAVVCCLDSVNYLTEDGDLAKCFSCVHNYLDPDGLFIFDVNSPKKFRDIYGCNSYVFEDELPTDGGTVPVYCGWQNCFDEQSGLCDFYLTVFSRLEDGTYLREDESQTERCYSRETLESTLKDCGFEVLCTVGGFDFSAPDEDTERLFLIARCKK